MQNNLKYLIATHPAPNAFIPLWAILAYLAVVFIPKKWLLRSSKPTQVGIEKSLEPSSFAEGRKPQMNRQTYFEARETLETINHALATEPLTPDERRELEHHKYALAGVLCRPWLPVPWGPRLIMAGIVLFILQQALTGNYEPFVYLPILLLFSPRIMGWLAFCWGRMKAGATERS
jgi:hypothetical protein